MPPTNQPIPPAARAELSVKQQREARRAEKVAQLKKKQAAEKRNRLIAIVIGSVAVVAVIGLVITLVVSSGARSISSDGASTGAIKGLQTYDNLTQTHVDGTVDYAQTPPVGGDHAAAWLNCGIYDQPVPTENAVHDLEHGAVWVTYNPDEVTGDDLTALRNSVPNTYITMSPWPDLQAPVVASAWGAQVELTGVDDKRLGRFIRQYRQSPDAPERGALCTGGLDAPGRVA